MWKRMIGKEVKIVMKLRRGTGSVYGQVIDANNSFLVTKDQHGKIHFLNVKGIVRVSEWNSQGRRHEEDTHNGIVERLDRRGRET